MRTPPVRQLALRAADSLLYLLLEGTATIFRALPSRWVLSLADFVGWLVYWIDRRSRRAGRGNLRAVFGDGLTTRERNDLLLSSFRNNLRSVFLLVHISPLTPERVRRWVDLPAEVEARFRESMEEVGTAVLVSGHIGSWELLLGLPKVFAGLPEVAFLAEPMEFPALNRFLVRVRGSGGGDSVFREGGARALYKHVGRGGAAALLVDRNVRGQLGGIWSPFLGLRARTTPLPARLALRADVHLLPLLCLPAEGGRYRIWVGPNLNHSVPKDDPDAAIQELTDRVNRILERIIRERPEIWNWTLKRFKSRPTRELGPYPAYSLWDDD